MSVILKDRRKCVSNGERGRWEDAWNLRLKHGEEEGWQRSVRNFGLFPVHCPTVLPWRLVETVCMDWVNLAQKHETIFQP